MGLLCSLVRFHESRHSISKCRRTIGTRIAKSWSTFTVDDVPDQFTAVEERLMRMLATVSANLLHFPVDYICARLGVNLVELSTLAEPLANRG